MKLKDKTTYLLDFVMSSLLAEMSTMNRIAYNFSKGKKIDSDEAATLIMEFQLHLIDESSERE